MQTGCVEELINPPPPLVNATLGICSADSRVQARQLSDTSGNTESCGDFGCEIKMYLEKIHDILYSKIGLWKHQDGPATSFFYSKKSDFIGANYVMSDGSTMSLALKSPTDGKKWVQPDMTKLSSDQSFKANIESEFKKFIGSIKSKFEGP